MAVHELVTYKCLFGTLNSRSNKRRYISQNPIFAVQDQTDSTYNAYEKDIGNVFVNISLALHLIYTISNL